MKNFSIQTSQMVGKMFPRREFDLRSPAVPDEAIMPESLYKQQELAIQKAVEIYELDKSQKII